MSFFELCVAGVGVCAQAAERRAHSRSSLLRVLRSNSAKAEPYLRKMRK